MVFTMKFFIAFIMVTIVSDAFIHHPVIRSNKNRGLEMSIVDDLLQKVNSLISAATTNDITTVTAVATPIKTVIQQVVPTVASTVSTTELSGIEVAGGIALGLAPYLLIPVLLLSAVKGLVKPPKPLPVQVDRTTVGKRGYISRLLNSTII